MKHSGRLRDRIPALPATLTWQRSSKDTLLALGGVMLVTAVIALTHLYPRIPTISLVYLLVVLTLASTRGLYAAVLASLLSLFSFDFFFFPPSYTLAVFQFEDLITLCVFLVAAILTSQLASALRRRVEQANKRERETRLLYEQAQELAALQERQRLARELHDSVSQVLYSIGLGSHTIQDALLDQDYTQAQASAGYVIALAEAGLAEMRALIFELRPESLITEGLVAALVRQVEVLRTRYKLVVDADLGAEPAIPLEQKQALYRIAQEALHNVVKHARASTVVLRLYQQAETLFLEVRDDGRGFNPDGPFPGHMGMESMHERASKIGGTLTIESAPGQATRLAIQIPQLLPTS